jgi:hypothetical protein
MNLSSTGLGDRRSFFFHVNFFFNQSLHSVEVTISHVSVRISFINVDLI